MDLLNDIGGFLLAVGKQYKLLMTGSIAWILSELAKRCRWNWDWLGKKVLKRIGIFIILTAIFFAWQDQSEKRKGAESERDIYKQRAEYNQKRIDRYLDADRTNNASSKNNSDNSGISIGGNNTGNFAVLKDSPNSPVTQTIINPLPEPTAKTNLLVLNEPYQIGYRTKFSVTLVNSIPISTNDSVYIQWKYPKHYNMSEPTWQRGPVNRMSTPDGDFYDQTWYFTFYTSEKVQESDFGFLVQSTPLKKK